MRDQPLTRFSRNARMLNHTDYHAILHSMLTQTLTIENLNLEVREWLA